MFFSVIIPVYHDWQSLEKCVSALLRQALPRSLFEVLVVNNDPGDSAPDGFWMPDNFRVINESAPGSYSARNAGARVAIGEVLVFTDADCIPDEKWLEAIYQFYQDNSARCLLSGKVEMFSPERELGKLNFAESYDYTFGINQDLYAKKGLAATANLSIPKAVFEEVGGFDASLFSGGDGEFCKAAAIKGFSLIYQGDVVVKHPLRKDIASLMVKARRMAGGYIKKNGFLKGGYMLAPPVVRVKILLEKDQPLPSKLKSSVVLFFLKCVQIHFFFMALVTRGWEERR